MSPPLSVTRCPTRLFPMVRSVVALRAAMQLDLSYFPEQVDNGQSPYEHLRDLYMTTLMALQKRIKNKRRPWCPRLHGGGHVPHACRCEWHLLGRR